MILKRSQLPASLLLVIGVLLFGATSLRAQNGRIEALEKAHLAEPKDPLILLDLAVAYDSAGKHADAARAFEEVIELVPEQGGAYLALGFSYLKMNRKEEALAMVRKGAAMLGNSVESNDAMGRIFSVLEMYDSATVYLRKGLLLEPNNLVMLRSLGLVTASLREIPESIEIWNRIATLTPNDYEAYFYLGTLYNWKKTPSKAIEPLKKALSLKQTAEAYQKLGESYAELGEYGDALAAFQEAVKLEPGNSHILYSLGRSYFHVNDAGNAMAAYREAIRLDSSLAEAYLSLAIAHFSLKEADEALRIARMGVKLKPEISNFHDLLVGLYALRNDMENAKRELEILRKLDPEFAKRTEAKLKAMGKKL
jgi:tetratricopeptide (TPR) repeat protein